jgi:hypothetical protein
LQQDRVSAPHAIVKRSKPTATVWELRGKRLTHRDRFSLSFFPVADLASAVARVGALGGEIVPPGERWAICCASGGTPFALTGPHGETE